MTPRPVLLALPLAAVRRAALSLSAALPLIAGPGRAPAQTVASSRTSAAADSAAAQQPAPPPPPPPVALPITFFGEVRTRSEWDRPGGGLAADAFTYLRARFGARIDPAPGVRILLQIQDSRVLGAEGNTTATAPDAFDLHQGYVELAAPWRGTGAAVRAGRQEIAFGNERLVGAVGWSNTGRSFDGVRFTLAPEGAKPGAEPWSATAFAATVEERGRRFGAAPAGAASGTRAPDHAAAGAFAARALPRGGTLEATALYDGGARYRVYDRANRATLDARVRAPRVRGLAAELEGAYQLGRQRVTPPAAPDAARDQRVRAWLVGARLGTAPASASGPRAAASLGMDVLSGDGAPDDGTYGAFNTMFATNHPFYGLMDLFLDPAARTRDRGLVDALATGAVALSPSASLRAELHHFALAAGAERPLGWEADVVLPLRMSSVAGVELGYTLFRADRGASAIGLGANGALRHWTYLQLRAGF